MFYIFCFLFPADRPDAVRNCSQYNHSSDAIYVRCEPGYDGGLNQIFTLELFPISTAAAAESPMRNLTVGNSPTFAVHRLSAGSVFEARIYASNRKGRSPQISVKISTLKRPSEKRLATTLSGGKIGG